MSMRSGPVFFLAALATLALLGPALFNGPVGHASPASFTLFGRYSSLPAGWGLTSGTITSPGPTLTVAPGERVDLLLNSDDGLPHDWGVDYNDNGISDGGEPKSEIFGSIGTSFTFDATMTPGTYQYYCFIHGPPMVGSFIVEAAGPDFSIGADPTTIGPLNLEAQGTSTIAVSAQNGFTDTVDLTVTPAAGLAAGVDPASVSGGSGTATLTVSAASAGSYSVTVTGTSRQLSHSVEVAVNVVGPDFSLSAMSTFSVGQGSSGSFNASLQSVGGFSGNVALAVSVSPVGPSVSVSPGTVVLAEGGAGAAVVSVSAAGGVYSSVAAGVYTVRVTGTGGSVSRSVDVAVTVGSPGGSGVGSVPLPYLLGGVAGAVGLVGAVVLLVRRGRPRK